MATDILLSFYVDGIEYTDYRWSSVPRVGEEVMIRKMGIKDQKRVVLDEHAILIVESVCWDTSSASREPPWLKRACLCFASGETDVDVLDTMKKNMLVKLFVEKALEMRAGRDSILEALATLAATSIRAVPKPEQAEAFKLFSGEFRKEMERTK